MDLPPLRFGEARPEAASLRRTERLLPPLSEVLAMRLGVVSLERGLYVRRDFGRPTSANRQIRRGEKVKGNQKGEDGETTAWEKMDGERRELRLLRLRIGVIGGERG